MIETRTVEPRPEDSEAVKKPYETPRLSFVEPALIDRGSLVDVTAGFFGTFIP